MIDWLLFNVKLTSWLLYSGRLQTIDSVGKRVAMGWASGWKFKFSQGRMDIMKRIGHTFLGSLTITPKNCY